MQDNAQNTQDDYKKALDALMERTARNWWKTGHCTKENACTGSIDLCDPNAPTYQKK